MKTAFATVVQTQGASRRLVRWIESLNSNNHRASLWIFMAIVLAHWAEHVVQAIQVFALGWPRPESRGLLGLVFPWLVSSEGLHYAYAILMLLGLALLRPALAGRARTWWTIALGIQFWHHIEHAILLAQVILGVNFFGRPVPTSVVQLVIMRVELHLLYNALVLVPMVVAMTLHLRPREDELGTANCSCAQSSGQVSGRLVPR